MCMVTVLAALQVVEQRMVAVADTRVAAGMAAEASGKPPIDCDCT
jgi:hypothetical protein